jgi:hypothetical protein
MFKGGGDLDCGGEGFASRVLLQLPAALPGGNLGSGIEMPSSELARVCVRLVLASPTGAGCRSLP